MYQAAISECTADAKAFLEKAVAESTILDASQVESTVEVAGTSANTSTTGSKKIVAITACPTGVAHTFMAAEALEAEGKRLGHQIKVETRGSVGAKNQLTDQEIADADLVIIAADIDVPLDRFNGKALYKTTTGPALKKTKQEMEKAFAEAKPYQHTASSNSAPADEKKGV